MHLTPWTKKVSEEVKKVENMFFGQILGKVDKTKPRKVQNNVQSTAPKNTQGHSGQKIVRSTNTEKR